MDTKPFDPQPGEIYRHDRKGFHVKVIGADPISSKIAPAVRCATVVNDDGKPREVSIWMDVLHNDYSLVI